MPSEKFPEQPPNSEVTQAFLVKFVESNPRLTESSKAFLRKLADSSEGPWFYPDDVQQVYDWHNAIRLVSKNGTSYFYPPYKNPEL